MIAELLVAVAENPEVVGLRVRAAGLLAQAGRLPEALEHCVAAVGLDPGNHAALAALQEVSAKLSAPSPHDGRSSQDEFDWTAAEEQVQGIVEPAFVSDLPGSSAIPEDVERPGLTLADVAGMAQALRGLAETSATSFRFAKTVAGLRQSLELDPPEAVDRGGLVDAVEHVELGGSSRRRRFPLLLECAPAPVLAVAADVARAARTRAIAALTCAEE